ncbi:MAG: 30S ribosomal protein S15 [Nitrospirae bacterium]|nr:30S ribosomal protein S15 [Nitrospirota bacterium]
MASFKERKTDIIKQFELHGTDTGSPEVQIALISERLNTLMSHFQTHKKDQNSRKGLLKLVGRRRRLLGYLKRTQRERYDKLVKELGLRG